MNCGACTLCCYALPVPSIGKKAYETCKYCTKDGCSIYSSRPDECKQFRCAWLQMPKVSEDLRPDNVGTIFEKISDRLFFGTVAFETPKVAEQILAFNKQGFSVVIAAKNQPYKLFLAKDHIPEDIAQDYLSYVKEHKEWRLQATQLI